jgi:2-iminobutanoate/2-iminopropanoate deaminase
MLTVHRLNDRVCAHSKNAAHGMEVPPNARILFCNGQVGARLDGTVPDDPPEQIEVIFERIRVILAASNMTFDDVVKFTIYVTDKSILDDYFSIRERIMGDHTRRPRFWSSTLFPVRGSKSRSKQSPRRLVSR